MMNRTYIVNQLSERHFQDLMNLYNERSWTKTRTSDEVRKMIDNSYIFGLCDSESDQLVGFTRVVTDYVFRATIYDVIVLEQFQGQGFGRLLLEAVVNSTLIKGLERVDLFCADQNVLFYEKWGFQKVPVTTNYMSLIK
ncbi:GNAT family N-acetyltransferase [Paenibacillus sp. MMS18-CY102]|uniref:GNAT family N-acetyltransferase n=1 Tax=Paenibacillus sp. MMS18-CY102 TaxID=2682849 RepID=UPI0013A8AF10|nr:GNAT family N-acetyltransferase [Paenibacillus sp. MMS18-CY102]MWC30451.1 GNAT family N-acetyltransferase [Paenibacillus sp. MMS18-CY102]